MAILLGKSGDLPDMLHQCCQIIVERLGVTFCRIWTLAPQEQTLTLRASAGLYTHLDGVHARVQVGQYKIGLIAQQRQPHLTNCVLGDRLVHDQEWALREGMRAFAGYPLMADGEVVGVFAMFSRAEISQRDFSNLEIIAGIIAHFIRRKQIEQALRESEARFRNLAEGIALIPWEADGQTWQFTYVGPQAVKILGYPAEAWYGPGFWVDHIHPDDRENAVAFCHQQVKAGKAHYQFEYRMLRADGETVWFLDIVNAVSRDGGGTFLQGFLIDVTKRKQAEQKIQEGQQRLQLMADALPALIAYVDAEGRYQFNNAAYQQWFGIPPDGYRGRFVRDILGEAAFEAVRPRFEAALAGEPQSFEQRVPYHGAGTRDVQIHYVPHRSTDGKVAGLFALILDISERKQAEETLRDREARLRAILDTAVDAIITIDQAGIIESVNPATERLFGYSAAELIGQEIARLLPPPYDDEHDRGLNSDSQAVIKYLLASGRELSARRKDGSVFPIELSISEVQDGKRWYTGIIHDLSRRKALERQVLEVSDQEQQRIAQELHDGVGQELTGLSLMADAISRRLPDSCPAEKQLTAKLAAELVHVHQQVRTLCRELIVTELDPNALRLALEDLAHRTSEQTGVACSLDCTESFHLADSITAQHLYRIVQEAVSNALRHGRPKHIWLNVRCTADGLCVSVRDDGSGVIDSTNGSHGMGIPTMRYRAGIIGGILQIRSAKGEGTVVTCTLSRV